MKKIILDLSDILIILISIYFIYILIKRICYYFNEIDFNFNDFFKLKIKEIDSFNYILISLASIFLGLMFGKIFIEIIDNMSKYSIIFQF